MGRLCILWDARDTPPVSGGWKMALTLGHAEYLSHLLGREEQLDDVGHELCPTTPALSTPSQGAVPSSVTRTERARDNRHLLGAA